MTTVIPFSQVIIYGIRRTPIMKKINRKLFVCALIAAAMASMTAVSAGAIIDYGGGNGGSAAPSTTTPTTTTSKTDDTPVTVLTDTAVTNTIADAVKAGKTEVTIKMTQDMNGKTTVQESAIAEIAKNKVTVKVEIVSVTGIGYTAVIDPAKITEAKALDLSMAIIPGGDGVNVSGFDVPKGNIVIAPNQHGDFGVEVGIILPAAVLTGVDSNSRLYYIDDNGNVEKMPRSAFKMNADGTGTVSISHASQYVLSSIDLTKLAAQLSAGINLDDDDPVDEEATIDDDVEFDDDDGEVVTDDDYVVDGADDSNPGTGVALAIGALAASAAAVVITAKKRK